MENDERQKLWKRIHGLEKDVSILIGIVEMLSAPMNSRANERVEWLKSIRSQRSED